MKEQPGFEEVDLNVILPYKRHDANLDERSKARMQFIQDHARVIVVSDIHDMVDQADYLIAVYDNEQNLCSRTMQMVKYAEQKGMPIIFIHPDTGKVF